MSNPVYAFFNTPGSLAPVFLRMALVAIFGFHGGQKAFGLFGGSGFSASLDILSGNGGLGLPVVVAVFAIGAEVAVAALLFLGLFTRLAALGVVILMSGALSLIHSGSAFAQLELPLLVLAAGLSLLFSGGGYLSLDRRIGESILPNVGGGYRGLRLT